MRPLSLALLLLLSAPAWAKDPPKAQQFVDRTYVEVPKTAGPFVLLGTSYDAKEFSTGVATEWKTAAGSPSLRIDVFVYPQGRADEAEAVAGSMGEVEAAIAEAEKRGIYSKSKLEGRAPFVVVRPDPTVLNDGKKPKAAFDSTPLPESKLEVAGDSKDPMLKALAESQPSPNNHGLRQNISLDRDGGTWRSAAFVFYRHLFLFKVRISVPVEEMSQQDFDRLADSAAREVVPRINVVNYGACGTIEVAVPPKGSAKDKTDAEGAAELIRGIARIGYENCANAPGDKDEVPPGFERVVIEYPAGTWKQGQ